MQRNDTDDAGEHQAGRPALKGVRRALEVLEYLAVHPGRAIDTAEGLGVSWATLHRTLNQLERDGFLKRDPETNKYSIGPRMWFIGTVYLADHPVLKAAQQYLEEAGGRGNYTIQLVERSGRLAVTLYSHQKAGEIITKSTYGYHFPLHCGSKGQVLLAYSPPEFIDWYLATDLEKLTSETITDPEKLRSILAEIRDRGYSRTEGDVQAFTGSLSAPVFNRQHEVPAAVCFITRRSVLANQTRADEMLETLLKTAQMISVELGWRPGR